MGTDRIPAGLRVARPASRRSFLGIAVLLLPAFLRDSRAGPATNVYRIAYLDPNPEDVDYFRERIGELGFREGRNLELRIYIERSVQGVDEDIRLAIAWKPHLVVCKGLELSRRLQRLAPPVPVVFTRLLQPQEFGLVESLARPGANMTGVHSQGDGGKRLELVRLVAPQARRAAVIFDSRASAGSLGTLLPRFRQAASSKGLRLIEVDVARYPDMRRALKSLDAQSVDAAFTIGIFSAEAAPLPDDYVAFQRRTRIPLIMQAEQLAERGVVISYSSDWREHIRLAADQAARILRGAKAATLPVIASTRFWLVVNRRAAREIGLALPGALLIMADRVID